MRRLIYLDILICCLFCMGCMDGGKPPSALDMIRSESNQTHHYRPVHRAHSDWTIGELGKSITLRTGGESIKATARRESQSVVVRENGRVMGAIEGITDGAKFDSESHKIVFHCLRSGDAEIVIERAYKTFGSFHIEKSIHIVTTHTGLAANRLEIRPLEAKHRYSLIEHKRGGDACEGTELEMPFSQMGGLIFHLDSIDLPQRLGLAWYVTRYGLSCQ